MSDTSETGLVCGSQVQVDLSGVGHCKQESVMATTERFEGYRIRFEFSPSDLGDCAEAEAHADQYASLCEDALTEQFPGADVAVEQAQSPKTRVFTPDDGDDPKLAEEVRWVTEQVWADGGWWPETE